MNNRNSASDLENAQICFRFLVAIHSEAKQAGQSYTGPKIERISAVSRVRSSSGDIPFR